MVKINLLTQCFINRLWEFYQICNWGPTWTN